MRDTSIPTITTQSEVSTLRMKISATQAKLLDQGYSYNQPTFTYNQLGVDYGGVYNIVNDFVPQISFAATEIPMNIIALDIYTNTPVSRNQSVGPGWFMYVTQ